MIVVDASVLANAIGDDEADGAAARDAIRQRRGVSAPDLVAVLRKRWLAGTLPARRFASAVRDLEELAIDRYPTLRLMWLAYELRENVTAYEAAYVALAEALDCPLGPAEPWAAGGLGIDPLLRTLVGRPPFTCPLGG